MDIRRRATGKAHLIQGFDFTYWPQWALRLVNEGWIKSLNGRWYFTAVGKLEIGSYLVEDESGRHFILSVEEFDKQWLEVEDE